ncbi:DEAD/DEAH box helicase [Nocardioides fonticola]|uniref:DEAD/DEAH box helicase n=1 Tax=Nocardioides fonticola TaxID=450363 RepID=A0ABP7XQ44_9ACTN
MTTRSPAAPPGELLERLAARPGRAERLTHVERLDAREARTAPWPTWVAPDVTAAFAARGITELWVHQAAAADHARRGEHVVLATGTASGKSLGYQLPALTAIREGRGPRGQRGAGVLYLAPTKALAHDQAGALEALGLDVRITTCDGDSSREQRDWAREHGEYVLTNPDMLHRSILPRHDRWAGFLRTLRVVVIDEAHHYRGVFGAHVAQVLRRLRRVAALYGADPVFVLASATMADPDRTAERLLGMPARAVVDDGSPRGPLTLGLWEPPFTEHHGENGAPVRRSANAEAADLLTDAVLDGARALAFVRSRRAAEQVAATTADILAEVDPALAGRIAAYRGGYLPEERREIEAALRSGRLRALATTSALELGIDVHGLDTVVLAGFPGTRAALWQRIGRAGRDGASATAVLVARDDPLDTYLVRHPEALLDRPVEATVFDPANPHVLGPHLCAAAQEAPLTRADLPLFGPTAGEVVERLVELGLLRKRPRGWFWTHPGRAADLADLRSASGSTVQLLEAGTGRVVGTVDGGSADATVHEGAVYVHRGETWVVEELDLTEHVAVMRSAEVDHSTSARSVTDIRIVAEHRSRDWGPVRLAFGEVDVSTQVVSYLVRDQRSAEVIAEEPLDLPVRTLRTAAVWWTVPEETLEQAGLAQIDLAGAAHAAEHCSIGLLPLIATCDRWDIGGVSTVLHPDTGHLTVFVHDGHPGGAGFAERGFTAAHAWLTATREAIEACGCTEGCPSCVQSPKCGNQNNPLDKAGALALLDLVLAAASPDTPEPADRAGPTGSDGPTGHE